jgi:hypothetical protein
MEPVVKGGEARDAQDSAKNLKREEELLILLKLPEARR